MKTKVCQACGEALGSDTLFCGKCGTKYEAPPKEIKNNQKVYLIRKMIYSMPEAALALNISVSKLQQIVNRGEIAVCRQGKNVGFTEWALEEYARSNETGVRGELKIV